MTRAAWIVLVGLIAGCGGSEASHLYAPDLQGDAGDDLSDAASNEPPDVEVEAGTGTGTGAQCVPGHQANCMCPNQTWGWQVCANDGSHYSACQCPSPVPEEDEEDEWEEPLPPPPPPEQDAGTDPGVVDPYPWPPNEPLPVRCLMDDGTIEACLDGREKAIFWHYRGAYTSCTKFRPASDCPKNRQCTVYNEYGEPRNGKCLGDNKPPPEIAWKDGQRCLLEDGTVHTCQEWDVKDVNEIRYYQENVGMWYDVCRAQDYPSVAHCPVGKTCRVKLPDQSQYRYGTCI